MFKKYIGTKEFYREAGSVAFPIMVQQLITSVVNLVDNLMVGSLGEAALSAVTVTNQIFFIPQLAIQGAVSAAGIFISQFYGANDEKRIKQTFRYKIVSSLLLALIAIIVVLLFKEQLLGLFLTTGSTIELAKTYMNIIIFTQIPVALIFSIGFTFREIGMPKYALIAGLFSIATNTILNYLLIYGNFGFPELGVGGAAIATMIARLVELSILIFIMIKTKAIFRTKIYRIFKIHPKLIKDITIKGIPFTVNEIFWSAAMTALFYAYSLRGETAIAAFSISNTITNMFYVVFGGMAGAVAILIGNRLGANKLDEAKQNARQLIALGLVVTITLSTILNISAHYIPYLFDVSEQTIAMATRILQIISIFFPFFFLNTGFFFIIRAGGDTKSTLIMDALFMWVIPVPLAFVLGYYTTVSAPLMYLFIQFCELIKFSIAYRFYKKGNWVKNLAS